MMASRDSSKPTLLVGGQFGVRTIFIITIVVAVTYGCLNWFGVLAHFLVWAICLIAGPFVGMSLGISRLKESDPILKSIQGGAIGGLAGFLGALLLLAPTFVPQSLERFGMVALLGSQAAFAAGGMVGLIAGAARILFASHKR